MRATQASARRCLLLTCLALLLLRTDPNASSGTDGGGFFGNPPLTPAIHDCRQGGLFSILEDPEERHDLREQEGAKAAALLAALEAANRTLYNPPPGKADLRCWAAERGGFIGPWLK